MMRTIHGVIEDDGRVRLLEDVQARDKQHVLVTLIEEDNEDFIAGYPVSLLMARPALADWDRPQEDEAWKDYQDEAK